MSSTPHSYPNTTAHTVVGRKTLSTGWLLNASGVKAGLIRLFTLKAGRRGVVFGSIESFKYLLRTDGVKAAPSTIRNALTELEKEGFLLRLFRYRGGSQVDSVYLILLDNVEKYAPADYVFFSTDYIEWAVSQANQELKMGYGLRTTVNNAWHKGVSLDGLFRPGHLLTSQSAPSDIPEG